MTLEVERQAAGPMSLDRAQPGAAPVRRPPVTAEALLPGVLAGQRAALGRAITLVESRRPQHQAEAQQLLKQIAGHGKETIRVGVTGVPGAGKSTFLEAMGTKLCQAGHKVAVLAVDPSSHRTGGSILADKTRMQKLSREENAFVRPSPSSGTLGGVNRATRETMQLVEAAGYDIIFVETVGVGQSETLVAQMVDFFMALMISGAGDEFQGIKKGVLEEADMIVVNKADGDNVHRARTAASQYRSALHIMTPKTPTWAPPAMTCSALTGDGLDEVWATVLEHRTKLTATGELAELRQVQLEQWMWAMVEGRVLEQLRGSEAIQSLRKNQQAALRAGETTATLAADALWALAKRDRR